jgi:hypothetical protein
MSMLSRFLILSGLLIGLSAPHDAKAEDADLELVLLADSSGSIDDAETAFQRQGHAAAITHPDVMSAIRQGPLRRIAVAYVEWGDSQHQYVVVPWTVIDGPGAFVVKARDRVSFKMAVRRKLMLEIASGDPPGHTSFG